MTVSPARLALLRTISSDGQDADLHSRAASSIRGRPPCP